MQQSSDDWEWVIADDGSQSRPVIELLDQLSSHARIVLVRSEVNTGIVAATNRAIDAASGEFLAFLDHDDMLTFDALESVGAALAAHPDSDLIYSDEAKIGTHGDLYDWFAKPDWSPERLRGHNYLNHLTVVRTSLTRQVGGLRAGFDGAQDHDLVLRLSEQARLITHVPRVLYHWRAAPGSTAADENAKPSATSAGCRAIREHLDRIGIDADVRAERAGRYRSVRALRRRPLVSIIIPTRGDSSRILGRPLDLVSNAVESVITKSSYSELELVVVHDKVTSSDTLSRLAHLTGSRLTLVPWSQPFNFAQKVNLGAVRSLGDVLILLNDDTEVISPDWIETFVALLEEDDVGMVGPMLLFADGRIQSAGHHYTPTPLHVGSGAPCDDPGPHALFTVAGERSGVTAACAGLRRSTFFEVGGLSEMFPACYNDVDLGFKLIEAGYRIVWTPHARLFHFESTSRDPEETPDEARELQRRWGRRLGTDRFVSQLDLWWAEAAMVPPAQSPHHAGTSS